MKKIFLLITVLISFSFQSSNKSTHLIIQATNFQNNDGQVLLDIFSSKEGFPNKRGKAMKSIKGTIVDKAVTFVIRDLAVGEYAFALIHDENNNNELDVNWIGIPTEALGVSKNAEGNWGPPSYEDAAFKLTLDKLTMKIKMKKL